MGMCMGLVAALLTVAVVGTWPVANDSPANLLFMRQELSDWQAASSSHLLHLRLLVLSLFLRIHKITKEKSVVKKDGPFSSCSPGRGICQCLSQSLRMRGSRQVG